MLRCSERLMPSFANIKYVAIPQSSQNDSTARTQSGRLFEERRYWLALFLVVAVVVSIAIAKTHRNGDDTFHFEPLTEEQLRYVNGERLVEKNAIVDNIEANNSDPLPPRKFAGITAASMCQSGMAKCLPPFVKFKKSHFLAAPDYHLIMCLIPKNLSTVMALIFCYLLREKEFISAGRNITTRIPDVGLCHGKNTFVRIDRMFQALNIKNMSEWKFAMVTRDPADRFLSGFIDRCIRVHEDCYGCGNNMTCFIEAEYRKAAEYAYDQNWDAKNLTRDDWHMFPQNWHCYLRDFQRNYEYIRYSSNPQETLLKHLKHLFKSQGVPESSIAYISESLQSGRTAHSTVMSSSRKFLEQRLRSSPYLMEMIVRLFYHDYTLLGYPLPNLDMADSQKPMQWWSTR
ncbi:hypothetical protein Y032_0534g3061 [Ancylostoma ceylanicum]|uniref:Sulfotransferase domain-containing protein n=1 Tax=Ancylostoma ceylanicum TaxID=53326 RepID=A0A016WSV1_9BILA|nr:hypothetical protein Y032_0534g3061 [Ancylostoma ceylanicum]